MKFSKGEISKVGDQVNIKYTLKKRNGKVSFKASDYKEFATFMSKDRPDINKWIFFISCLVLLIVWVSLSEYMGNFKLEMTEVNYLKWKQIDNIVMPTLMIITFLTLFFDIMGDLKVARYFFERLFTSKQFWLIIILDSQIEYRVPVRNKAEAILLIQEIKN